MVVYGVVDKYVVELAVNMAGICMCLAGCPAVWHGCFFIVKYGSIPLDN